MLEGFNSFCNDVNYVNYDEVTKTQHAVMRARWGAVQLENAMPTKSIVIKLADNKPILILYLWQRPQYKGTLVRLYTAFFQGWKQTRITWLLTDSNPSSHRGRGQRSTSRITSSHTRTVVRECFKGDEASQWKRAKFDSSPHQNSLTDLHKNWQAWLRPGRHTACKTL